MFTHFYSDSHFGHKGIIGLCGRPYDNVDQMNEALINNYNSVVEPWDYVLWVGDAFFLSLNRSKAILDRLNGRKALIKGNHDRSCRSMVDMGFEFACEEMYLKVGEHTARVNHYPYSSGKREGDRRPIPWPEKRREKALIHGHTHSSCRRISTMIHVGCDAWNYAPVASDAVAALIDEI